MSSSPSPSTVSPPTGMSSPVPQLPASHPLAAELSSLRQQLNQYRAAAHQAGIQVQGVRLELDLSKEECQGLRNVNKALQAELDTLRKTPNPPEAPAPNNALSELSLAHRRLSAKLDFTEAQLSSTSLELASLKQELQVTQRARDAERAQVVELRRIEQDREEEIAWERSQRQQTEEQKKLCDLALLEYAALVRTLDPSAVPPPLPTQRVSDNILQNPPLLTPSGDAPSPPPKPSKDTPQTKLAAEPETDSKAHTKNDTKPELNDVTHKEDKGLATPKEAKREVPSAPPSNFDLGDDEEDDEIDQLSAATAPSPAAPLKSAVNSASVAATGEAISSLLIGQRGVHRLFRDFSSTLSARDKEINDLHERLDRSEAELNVVREQLETETAGRVEAQNERDRVLRDDASATKVVERYMSFSQKAHTQVHKHLGDLRERSSATQASLRSEANYARRRLNNETDRAARLRTAAEEMAAQLGRESAGRRREIALRLQLIAAEEARGRKADVWLDKVRRARADEAAISPDTLSALVDEASALLGRVDIPDTEAAPTAKRSWRGRWLGNRKVPPATPTNTAGASPEEESLARIFLAEDLVAQLSSDLQTETERRVALEKQRMEWLAKEAEDGVPPETEEGKNGDLVWDADVETEVDVPIVEEGKVEDMSRLDQEEEAEELAELQAIFEPLQERYTPLQKSLHDQSISLASIRASLPSDAGLANAPGSIAGKRQGLRALALRPSAKAAQDDLVAILDSLHEVIEDARVDAEIAVSDEIRVLQGFAALIGVGASGVVQASSVLKDARAYAERDDELTSFTRLETRVVNIELDLATIKAKMHELDGMDLGESQSPTSPSGPGITGRPSRRRSVWQTLELRTVSPSSARPLHPSLAPLPNVGHVSEDSADEGETRPRTGFRPGSGATRAFISSMGRSFSTGVVGAASGVSSGMVGVATGVASAPRRVTGFAGGLYKGPSRRSPSGEQAAGDSSLARVTSPTGSANEGAPRSRSRSGSVSAKLSVDHEGDVE